MDILTQMVLGGAVASQILIDEKPRKTIVIGSIIAAIPDLDVFFMYKLGELDELLLHRSFSHAILPFLVLSIMLVYFLKLSALLKNTSTIRLFIAVFFILLTHSLLDCLTTWGTQLFWPFDIRIATQTVYVIDLYYSVLIGLGLGIYFVFPKVKATKKANKLTLIASTVYLIILLVYQQIFILKIYEIERFSNAISVNTQANLFTPFKYREVIELSDTFYVSRQVSSVFDISKSQYYSIPKNRQYINEISEYFDLYPLYKLARGYLSITKIDSYRYRLTDLRYGPMNPESENYVSSFTYYIDIKDGKAIFSQNKRTLERLKALLQNIFS